MDAEAEFHDPWQMPEMEGLPDEEVSQLMTSDVVTVTAQTPSANWPG